MKAEEWRIIPSLLLYEASNFGRIRSKYRRGRRSPDGILKPSVDRKGYLKVYPSINCKKSSIHLHILVAEAYLGSRPQGHDVHHKDDNKQNNIPENLEYICHRKHTSLNKQGEKSFLSKLTYKQVINIRWLSRLNFEIKEIAAMTGINSGTIHSIIIRKSWKHL